MGDRGLRSQYHSNNNSSWWKWTGPRPTSPTLPVTFENYTNSSNSCKKIQLCDTMLSMMHKLMSAKYHSNRI
jgi:hypothetical protein